MSVCPGCGRCRQCGQPAPVYPRTWWYGPYVQPGQPIWIQPWTSTGGPAPQPPYYVGEPGQMGSITITNSSGGTL